MRTELHGTDLLRLAAAAALGLCAGAGGYTFFYAEGLSYELRVDGRTIKKKTAKGDQFAPELLYFSDCILRNRQPEPSGEEGMQDVRIVEALYESAEIGKAVQLPPYAERSYPTPSQEIRKSPVKKPELVNARQPST